MRDEEDEEELIADEVDSSGDEFQRRFDQMSLVVAVRGGIAEVEAAAGEAGARLL